MKTTAQTVTHECPLCGTYLPSIGHLLSEHAGVKARNGISDQDWADLFAIEAAINARGLMHLIGTTYDDGR